MRAVSMMSMPTSEGSLIRTLRWHGGSCPGVGGSRARAPSPYRDAFDPHACGHADGAPGHLRIARDPRSPVPPAVPSSRRSFDRHGFRQIARLVDVISPPVRNAICEQLQRHHRAHRLTKLLLLGDPDDLLRLSGDLVVIVILERDQYAGPSAHLFHVAAHLLVN